MFEQSRHSDPIPPFRNAGSPSSLIRAQSPLFAQVMESANRHHHQLLDQGAVFHERFDSFPWVRVSLADGMPQVALTGRWLARGVFTAALPVGCGEVLTGTLDVQRILSLNQGLTPRGTFETTPWQEHPDAHHRYFLPFAATVASAIRVIGQEVASKLLDYFPERLDVAPRGIPASADRAAIIGTALGCVQAATSEITHSLSYATSLLSTPQTSCALIIEELAGNIFRGVLKKAFASFRDIRLQTAFYQFETYRSEGPIAALVDSVRSATTQRAQSLISLAVFTAPLEAPKLHLLKGILHGALRDAIESRQEFKELWDLLSKRERQSLLKQAARETWSDGVRAYARQN